MYKINPVVFSTVLCLDRQKFCNRSATLGASYWGSSKLIYFNRCVIARAILVKIPAEKWSITRIPITRFNVALLLQNFSQCTWSMVELWVDSGNGSFSEKKKALAYTKQILIGSPDWKKAIRRIAVRNSGVSWHYDCTIKGPLIPLRASQHSGIKGGINWTPMIPRNAGLSDRRCNFIGSRYTPPGTFHPGIFPPDVVPVCSSLRPRYDWGL